MSNTKCSSPSLSAQLKVIRSKLSLLETWDIMEQGVVQLTSCCNTGGCESTTEMLAAIQSLSKPLNRAISSDRNSLSSSAIELINALLAGLGPSFSPLVSHFLPSLLALCARTNKVFTRRSKDCIFAIIRCTKSPSLLSFLAEALSHKSTSVRSVAAEGVLLYLTCLNPSDIVNNTRARLLENVIKSTARDASAEVRNEGKKIFKAYKGLLPDRVDSFIALLTPITKKHLAAQDTAASQSTSPVLSRDHSTTGPVASLQAHKIASSKHSDRRVNPLTHERTQDVRAAKKTTQSIQITSAAPRLPSKSYSTQGANQRKDVARVIVSTTQRSQRVPSVNPRNDPRVRDRTQIIPASPSVTNGTKITRTIRKTGPPSAKPSTPLTSKCNSEDIPIHPVNVICDVAVELPSRTGPLPFAKAAHPTTRNNQSESHGQSPTKVQQRMSLHATRTKVVASRFNQQECQNRSVHGGRPVSKTPKDIVKAESTSVVKLGAGISDSVSSGEPLTQATTPHIMHISGDASHLCIGATASPCGVNIQDPRVSKMPLSSIQNGYPSTPSYVQLDVNRVRRTPRQQRRISTSMERPQPPHRFAAVPSSCEHPIRPLVSYIQGASLLSPPTRDAHVPRDVAHVSRSSRADASPQGENLWRTRGAKFPVFKDPEGEAAALDPPSAAPTLHADGPHRPSATPIRRSPRRVIVPPSRRTRRPSEFKFNLPMLPLSPGKVAAPAATPHHLMHMLHFLDIGIDDIM